MKFQASRFSASGRKCPSSPTEVKHAAHASPCMFSRLERDVKLLFGVFRWPCLPPPIYIYRGRGKASHSDEEFVLSASRAEKW